MTRLRAALLLLLVQLLLVSSIAAKYAYERKTCSRVWSRATQYDPNLPLRGRYFALRLLVDACQLPRDSAHFQQLIPYGVLPVPKSPGYWRWYGSLAAAGGHLAPVLQDHPKHPADTVQLTLAQGRPCDRVPVSQAMEYFVPDHAQLPFPLAAGQELWVEVTVPPSGPPRPIQLALATRSAFRALHF